MLFCILKIIYALQGRRPEKEEGGRREKGVKIILLKKDRNSFLKWCLRWWMSTYQYGLMLKVVISKSLQVAEMVARAVEINTENDRLKAQEKEAEAKNGKHLKKREELEKERYVCSSKNINLTRNCFCLAQSLVSILNL